MSDNFLENSCCSSSSTSLRDPSFSTKRSSVLLTRNVSIFINFILSKGKKDIKLTTKTDNEIDSPGIEALEEFVDEERDPEHVVGTEVETGVSEEFNMADKFDEGDSKNFKQ